MYGAYPKGRGGNIVTRWWDMTTLTSLKIRWLLVYSNMSSKRNIKNPPQYFFATFSNRSCDVVHVRSATTESRWGRLAITTSPTTTTALPTITSLITPVAVLCIHTITVLKLFSRRHSNRENITFYVPDTTSPTWFSSRPFFSIVCSTIRIAVAG